MSGKKKHIRLHRALTLILAIVLTIVIAAVVFRRSGLLSYQLSSYINEHYLKDTPFQFSCGKIDWDIVGHISIADPALRYRDGGRRVDMFRARQIAVDYSLVQVLKLRMIVRNLEMEDVNINILVDDEGKPILPVLPSSEGTSSVDVLPHVVIDQFSIRDLNMTFESGGETTHFSNASVLGSLSYIQGEGEIEIRRGMVHLEESDLALRPIVLKCRFGPAGIVIKDLQLRTDLSFVRLSGRYRDGRLYHVQGVFNPLDLKDISALGLANEKGELGGNIVVEGTVDSLTVRGSLTGKALGLAFSGLTLEGAVFPDRVHLTHVGGAIFGSRLNGEVTYDRKNGNYAFSGVCEGLDISHGFVEGDVPETDLNGFVSLEFDARQAAYEIRGDLRRSTIEGFESDEIQCRLAYQESTGLRIRSARLARSGFELSGSGTLNADGEIELILALAGDSLDYMMDYVSLPRIGGRADLKGRLVGPLDRFQLNLNGTWQDLTYLTGTIDSSRVYAEARHVGSDDLLATIDIQGRHLELGERLFEEPHVLIRANTDEVLIRDFSFSKGDTFITSDFQVLPGEESSTVRIKHLVVRMPHSNWVNEKPATLVLYEQSANLDTLMLRSIGRRIGVVGDYRMGDRTLDVDGWGQGIDLQLIREALGLPFPLDGIGGFETHIHGDIDNPLIDLKVSLTGGAIDSLAFDTLTFGGGFSQAGYYVDSLIVVDRTDSLILRGSWEYMDSPFTVARDGLRREIAQDASVSIAARGHRFSLASLLRTAHRRPFWGGSFDGSVDIENTLASPHLRIAGQLVSRPEDRYQLPPITTDLTYKDGTLSIGTIDFDDGRTSGRASGSLGMDLNLVEGLALGDDRPIEIDITVSSSDLSAVAGYFKPIASSGGKLSGQVRIGGTPADIEYSGSIKLKDGVLKLMGLPEVYSNAAADVQLAGHEIQLRSLSGEVGKKGRFSGSGTAQIDRFRLGSYDLSLNLTDYTLQAIRDFEATLGGRVRIQSVPGDDGPIPMITGQVEAKQAVITKPIAGEEGPPSTVSLPTESPSWMCNIDIEAPNNAWVRNTDLNMELGGDVIIKRDTKGLYFRGDLSVLRGSYTLYNNKFRITDGRIDFSTATTLRPDISLSAYTPHRVAGQQERRIFLDLTWPSDKEEPTIALSYDAPGYSETDLWKMLGGQVVTGDGSPASAGAFGAATGTAQNLASNYLERILNAQMRDVTVEVESRPLSGTQDGRNGDRELTIAVGRYLSEDLYLKYQQGLSAGGAREVEIEYRISNLFLLRSEIIKHHGPKGISGSSRRTTDEINFDLKFRIEY